jgi:hypothetical protein
MPTAATPGPEAQNRQAQKPRAELACRRRASRRVPPFFAERKLAPKEGLAQIELFSAAQVLR